MMYVDHRWFRREVVDDTDMGVNKKPKTLDAYGGMWIWDG